VLWLQMTMLRFVLFAGLCCHAFAQTWNCADILDWNFFGSSLTQNNLGGLGPNFDDKHELRFGDVKVHRFGDQGNAERVDLVVTTLSPYKQRNNLMNGLWSPGSDLSNIHNMTMAELKANMWSNNKGAFGQVNVYDNTGVTLKFSLVEGGTDTPFEVKENEKILFSVFDLDRNRNKPLEHEYVQFNTPVASYSVPEDTTIEIFGEASKGTLFAQSTRPGDASDNPTDPLRMTKLQMQSTMTVTYVGLSSWEILFGDENGGARGGRNVLFAGRAQGNCLTNAPTEVPTGAPTTDAPITDAPTTFAPTTDVPTIAPTEAPSPAPSDAPTIAPTAVPSEAPSTAPSTGSPSSAPSLTPTTVPSEAPSAAPTTFAPTHPAATLAPSNAPSTFAPSSAPSVAPTDTPTTAPTDAPSSSAPSSAPSVAPTDTPTIAPTDTPTTAPTDAPTIAPTDAPTIAPTDAPTTAPTDAPTIAPTGTPTIAPTDAPTIAPTDAPTIAPTYEPSIAPTVFQDGCTGISDWTLHENLKYNNLGGQGPATTDPPELRYEKVFSKPKYSPGVGWGYLAVDLVVKVAEGSAYHAFNTARNGLWPEVPSGVDEQDTQMGQINIDSGTESTFDFMFVESGSYIPYALTDVLFSVYDLDQNMMKKAGWKFNKGKGKNTGWLTNHEYVEFPHEHGSKVSNWTLSEDPPTAIKESGSNDKGTLRFTSTEFGVLSDNPTNPRDLSPFQAAHTVTVNYADTSKFQVTFGHEYVGGVPHIGKKPIGGRNVIFAGPGIFCPENNQHPAASTNLASTNLASKIPAEMSNGSSDNNTAAILVVFVVVAAVVGVASTIFFSNKKKQPQDVSIHIDTAPGYNYNSCPSDVPKKFTDTML